MKFFAHRGYSKRFPENTLEAFEAVLDHPCRGTSLIGIELDIHLTADCRIAVMHDTTVRDDSGEMVPVARLPLDSVRRHYAASRGARFRVPELDEVLHVIDHRTELNLELKAGPYETGTFFDVLEGSLDGYGPRGDIVFSSFSFDLLRSVIEHTGSLDVKYGLLLDSWESWNSVPAPLLCLLDYVHPRYDLLLDSPGRLAEFECPVQTWTVDSASLVRRLLDLPGAPAIRTIMTNDLELAEQFKDG